VEAPTDGRRSTAKKKVKPAKAPDGRRRLGVALPPTTLDARELGAVEATKRRRSGPARRGGTGETRRFRDPIVAVAVPSGY
jgi:hypothetical protein